MKFKSFILFLATATLVLSCAREVDEEVEAERTAHVSGKITVDDTLDSSGDYSGIHLLSTIRVDENRIDTLFHAITDSTGNFYGTAFIDQDDIYTIVVSRNQNTFGIINLIFAEDDTVSITGRLPDLNTSLEVSSRENDVLQSLERVENNFSRIVNFINAGAVPQDSIHIEIEKWSDIYWQLFDENSGLYAAQLAGESAVSILRGWNDSLMVQRKSELLEQYNRVTTGTRLTLVEFYAETNGLRRALEFIDELKNRTPRTSDHMQLDIERIELLYDSARTTEATRNLEQFRETYSDNSIAMDWAESISYDLEFLAPGSPFPELSFTLTDGSVISTADLQGKPFLLEITRFDNTLYQQQYDRTVAIYQIYRNYELEIITVPIESSEVMLNAFFEERSKLWNVVQPDSFEANELIELLNLNRVPTRFLVNNDGTIIRRYIGNEYEDVVRGLQRIGTLNND
jgi:hypothetical protein